MRTLTLESAGLSSRFCHSCTFHTYCFFRDQDMKALGYQRELTQLLQRREQLPFAESKFKQPLYRPLLLICLLTLSHMLITFAEKKRANKYNNMSSSSWPIIVLSFACVLLLVLLLPLSISLLQSSVILWDITMSSRKMQVNHFCHVCARSVWCARASEYASFPQEASPAHPLTFCALHSIFLFVKISRCHTRHCLFFSLVCVHTAHTFNRFHSNEQLNWEVRSEKWREAMLCLRTQRRRVSVIHHHERITEISRKSEAKFSNENSWLDLCGLSVCLHATDIFSAPTKEELGASKIQGRWTARCQRNRTKLCFTKQGKKLKNCAGLWFAKNYSVRDRNSLGSYSLCFACCCWF